MIFVFFFNDAFAVNLYYGNYNENILSDYIDIPIVAVTIDETTGIIGQCRIGIINEGEDGLIFDERTPLDDSAMRAALDAYSFAQGYTGKRLTYFISYDLNTRSVSGSSTGASIASGMIALAMNKSYNQDYIISGAVSPAGDMLETGGLPIKILAVASTTPKMIMPEQDEYIYEKREIDGKEFIYARKFNLTGYAAIAGVSLIKTENLLNMLPIILNAKV